MYGKRMKELREERGLSQEAVAALLHCSQRTVSRYELEQIDLSTETLISLCCIFKVSADYILGLEDETGAKAFR